jgi:ubiquinol-cytochrome c reductase cytochrome c1 subunit
MIKKLLAFAALAVLSLAHPAYAAEGEVRLEHAPIDVRDFASLQSGARTFVNYCLNCHSAALVRYGQLREIGLTDDQIRDNLVFGGGKVGDLMTVSMSRKDAKEWFGVAPPDLSVTARSRGADWIYTYLRSFYRDPQTLTGWNNVVFPNVGMPHVMWELQGERTLVHDDNGGEVHGAVGGPSFTQVRPGKLAQNEYDAVVRDLTNFMVWIAEPHQIKRREMGMWVLIGLTVIAFMTWLLYKNYWKDVH